MATRIRGFDWAATSLGAMAGWPIELRVAHSLMERCTAPAAIYWGPDLVLLYNDAWAPIPAERHPHALGRPAADVWSDIWPVIEPQFARVLATGEGFAAEAQLLPMKRGGVVQETYWDYSFTPITGADGAVLGIFNQGQEVTRAVVTERRLSMQIALADRIRGLHDPEAVKRTALETLGEFLRPSRCGFVDIDEAEGRIAIRNTWTSGDVPSLAQEEAPLVSLPEPILAHFRSGGVLVIDDVEAFAAAEAPAELPEGDPLAGAKAVIAVPLARDGTLRALLYVHQEEPRGWLRSEAAVVRDVAERAWAAVERAEAEQRLRDSEDHYRHAVELNPQVSWTALPDGQLNRVSRRWLEWTGSSGVGGTWTEGLHPDDVARSIAAWSHSIATGEPYDIEHRVIHRSGEYRWARSRAFPRRDIAGAVCLWYGTTEDVHEQHLAQEHQRLLVGELNHRVKNTLATVQAIAFQTLKDETDIGQARRRFEARLMALARAHDLLTERNWVGAPLGRVVEDATSHLPPDRFDVDGPDLSLSPRAALALSLALHELGTNAAKHGALSAAEGRVAIGWEVADGRLQLEWKEQGGPTVAAPTRRGFGSRMIERALGRDLGGSAELMFEADGLRCRVIASLAAIRAAEAGG